MKRSLKRHCGATLRTFQQQRFKIIGSLKFRSDLTSSDITLAIMARPGSRLANENISRAKSFGTNHPARAFRRGFVSTQFNTFTPAMKPG